MTEKNERLKLEAALSQIYNNGNIHDGPSRIFSFNSANFICLNGVFIYLRQNDFLKIRLDDKMLSFEIGQEFIEIQYDKIDYFVINLKKEA